MTRFNDLFDRWAEDYDRTVAGLHPEYREVFAGYRAILEKVVQELGLSPGAKVLEIGVGTGNLSQLLLAAGLDVVGVEPSTQMRQGALAKLPDLALYEGHFLQLPSTIGLVDGVVSTYAFHHLLDQEKRQALTLLHRSVKPGGRLVFADTVFKNEDIRGQMRQEAKDKGFLQLANDLEREYYPLLEPLQQMFADTGWKAQFQQLNRYVWLMRADKQSS
ncbi:class I SAM-dependent methyltransferase [Desmospora activa]|uniref:Uncharacterized methyltransferase C8J48_2565 n=1 Tax=Desmospora activa DSM 45169 TaxID=1121389 RepID=A0A2T4ZDF3_9BACL|nr:class I SAM-dependent methyltransferase [Desmospora activa]PTM59928.1 putative AdoMet-dependent methyltransferase [Desmospora activa DSM 45169]